jgi:hypothetical protein
MLVFPQLSTGANAQYPLTRADVNRTVINTLQDGTAVKFEDVSASLARWQLRLDSLDEAERTAIEQLFLATEGELNVFTLLDPSSNLLGWSEDFSKSVWVYDSLLTAAAGATDPLGGTAAWQLTNGGAAVQKVAQTIAGPANFEYCFSVYVRGTGTVILLRGTDSRTFALANTWQRISSAGSVVATGDTFQVAIALPAGGQAQVFGAQLEAQPAAGPYRRSLASSGVAKVRFETDRLSTTAVGLDRHSSVIRLVSVE